MKIKDAENPAEIIREEKYEINPSYLYQLQYLTFDPIENSENKNFIIEISNDGNSTYSFANDENKKGEISLRPLYLNGKMINNVYYRISQYKPFFLKGPVLPITYWIFNLIFALFIFSHFSKSRK